MAKISQKIKKELEEFFMVLEKVASPSDPRQPKKLVYDLGLIIFENNSKLKAENVFDILPKGRARFFSLENPHAYDDFLKELVIANRESQWLMVDCQADPSPTIIGILKQLSEDGAFTVPHFWGKELFRMELNPKTRIVFCIKSNFLEEKVTYPFFMNLFGPIFRV